jgi:DNA primase catalytic subunit
MRSALFKYYSEKCPFDVIALFATCNGRFSLVHREVVFRYDGENGFKRYEHFETIQESEEYARERNLKPSHLLPLCFLDARDFAARVKKSLPYSVSLGPVFPCSSLLSRDEERKHNHLTKYAPLVFDVDTDADTVRDCECVSRQVCDQCWPVILRPAMLALREFLQKCGFQCTLFVFSGRRGFNCYVLDSNVWEWTTEQRMALLKRAPSFIKFDEAVTTDPRHLIKAPLLPHHATGIITAPIIELETFVPSMGIHIADVGKAILKVWSDFILSKLPPPNPSTPPLSPNPKSPRSGDFGN